ncbi:MAG TPA: RNA-binding protein [Candidatus Binatia bacterium]|nr:RNA-binding protein [Candidatus Binatia bacterium]
METKLYVGNLSYDVTKTDLEDAFGQHGPVQDVHVVTDRVTGRARGFAFVTMETTEAAEAAIGALNGADWHGRALTVNEARPREANAGGRGARRF